MGIYGTAFAEGIQQAGADQEIGLTLIGRALAEGDYQRARQLYDQMLAEAENLEAVPEWEDLVAQEYNAVPQIALEGEGRSAQQRAIQGLQSYVDQQGLDSQARGQLEEALATADQRNAANRGAIRSGMERRGMGGSGAELAMLLQGNQASANQARQSSLDIAGQARQRALDSLKSQAGIGGQMRGQDISVQGKNMDAERARQEFNARMRYASSAANNQGKLDTMDAKIRRIALRNQARAGRAGKYTESGNKTQSDWASMGRGLNYKAQMASDTMGDMPF